MRTCNEHADTGVGLAVCEQIVQRHGERIRVESASAWVPAWVPVAALYFTLLADDSPSGMSP